MFKQSGTIVYWENVVDHCFNITSQPLSSYLSKHLCFRDCPLSEIYQVSFILKADKCVSKQRTFWEMYAKFPVQTE